MDHISCDLCKVPHCHQHTTVSLTWMIELNDFCTKKCPRLNINICSLVDWTPDAILDCQLMTPLVVGHCGVWLVHVQCEITGKYKAQYRHIFNTNAVKPIPVCYLPTTVTCLKWTQAYSECVENSHQPAGCRLKAKLSVSLPRHNRLVIISRKLNESAVLCPIFQSHEWELANFKGTSWLACMLNVLSTILTFSKVNFQTASKVLELENVTYLLLYSRWWSDSLVSKTDVRKWVWPMFIEELAAETTSCSCCDCNTCLG